MADTKPTKPADTKTKTNPAQTPNGQGFSQYNQIKIDSFWLYRVVDGTVQEENKWIDMTPFHQELNIFEDIASQTLSAQVLVADPVNIADRFPIVGGERIKLTYSNPGFTDGNTLEFVVYKIGERIRTDSKTKAQAYWLYLCTVDRWADVNTDVSKSYAGNYTEIVRSCLTEIQSATPIDAVDSTGNAAFISPYWSPLKCVSFCAKRAVDAEDSPFLFWETVTGYKFKPMSAVLQSEPIKTLYYEPSDNKHHQNDMNKTLNHVKRFEFKESNNKLEQYARGSYGTRVFFFNLGSKIVSLETTDYRNDFKKTKSHVEAFPLADDMANKRTKTKAYVTTIDESHLSRYSREMIMTHLNNYRVLVECAGDTRIEAGQIILFDIPALSDVMPGYQKEVLVSGRWLIASVRHQIGRGGYAMYLELVKDSHAVDVQQIVYGKSEDDINADDEKRVKAPKEVMGVVDMLNRYDGIDKLGKSDERNEVNQNWIDRIKEWAFWK